MLDEGLTDEARLVLRGIAGTVAAVRAQVETSAHLAEIRRARATTTAAMTQMKTDLATIRRDTGRLSGRAGR